MRNAPNLSRRALALAAASLALSGAAHAQPAWPDRPVRLIAPTAPGSAPDVAGRFYAERLGVRWGVPVTVENRPGAGGTVAVEHLTQQRDGHALLFTFISALTVAPLLYTRLPFDPAEIAPISIGVADCLAIVAPTTPPFAGLAEAVAAIREQPGRLNWASGGADDYLTMVSFVRQQRLDMQYVAYRSSVLALPDLTQGRLQLLMVPLAAALPQARAGTLKLLAVNTPVRSPAAPDVPTVAEAGFPDLTFQPTLVFLGLRSMPVALRERIAADIRAVAADPGLAEKMGPLGMVPRAGTPDELARLVEENRLHWAERAHTYGVRPIN